MISSLHPRIRIALVLLSAFVISGVLFRYFTDEASSPPSFQMQKISDDFSQTVADGQSSLLALVESIQLPSFESTPAVIPTNTPTIIPVSQEQEWEVVPIPTIVPTTYTLPPTTYPSASLRASPQPTTYKPLLTAIPQPTKAPKPTKVPKPTAKPAPPPITSDVRPGSSIEEILQEVSKRACIPYALLMATRTEESGAWMTNMNASVTRFYNTYGWWKSAGQGEVCYALAYYTQSGKIPPDSGGGSCTNGVQPEAYDQKIMGIMQMSEQEEQVTRKYTQVTLPKSIDRRVLFDNALIYAIATKNRLGDTPKSCDDWPEDAVKAVAEKHYGACGYPGGNYCTEIWNLYKKFR